MEITISTVVNSEAALSIARENAHFFNAAGLEVMKQDLRSGFLFGAYDGKSLVGFVVFKELNLQTVELAWMAVCPALQGQGIGTKLVNFGLKSFSKQFKVCQMKTLSEIDPDPQYALTRKFYLKLGFIPLETIYPYPGWGSDNPAQLFVRMLS